MTPVVAALGQAVPGGVLSAADEVGSGVADVGDVVVGVAACAAGVGVTAVPEGDDAAMVCAEVFGDGAVAIVDGRLPAALDAAGCESQPACAARQKSTITAAMPGN